MNDAEAAKLWACLKVLWPGDGRLPEGWQKRWREHYDQVAVDTVCEALRFISDKSDPIRPTFDMVDQWLATWAICNPGQRPVGVAATDEQSREMRDRVWADTPEQAADREVCQSLDRAEFDRIAREEIAKFPPDVQALPSYRKGRDLMLSNHIRSLVAAHARAHGLVKIRVLEEVL